MDTYIPPKQAEQPPAIPGHDPVRCLGSGVHGHVWLMRPRDGSMAVAAKFLVPHAATASGVPGDPIRHNESEVTQEGRILAHFHHEHLISVRRVVKDSQGAPVLLMEYAAGGSLAQVVQARGPLTVGETVTVLTPMGQVLAYLHGLGAVHADVSPGNILLSAAGKPYLSDFGFGRLLGQGAGPLAGTPGFYSATDTQRDAASDVYALAAVGWFALTGRPAPPTRERMPLGTFVHDVPVELVAALEAGLDEDAARRPSAAAFAQAVFRSAPAEPVALGSAVHPSVLPELLTRRDVKARGGRRRRTRPRGIRRPFRTPLRESSRESSTGLSRRGLSPRGLSRRGSPAGMAWASEAGVVRRPRSRRAGRSAVAVLGLAATVAAAVGFFNGGDVAFLRRGAAPGSPVIAASSPAAGNTVSMAWAGALPAGIQDGLASQDPVAALHALAWTRSYALSTADEELLDMINAPGSSAHDADLAVVQSLKGLRHTLTGLETSITAASTDFGQVPVPASDSGSAEDPLRATVRATVITSAFAEQDAAGAVVHRQTREQHQQLEIMLTRVDARWTIHDVAASAG